MLRIRNAVKLVYSKILSRVRPANVAMFHIGRVGSTVTANMVGQHSQIHWGGEFFHPKSLANWREVYGDGDTLRLLRLTMPAAHTGIFGIDCKIHETQDPARLGLTTDQFVQSLIELGFDHFIFLERKNLLRRFVSSKVGEKRGSYHRVERRAELVRIHLDPAHYILKKGIAKSLTEWFDDLTALHETVHQQVADYPTLNLTYEEDVLPDPHVAYEKICTFLEVPPEDPTARYKKISSFPLDEIITNYDEVATYLHDTPYAWMLEDEKQYT